MSGDCVNGYGTVRGLMNEYTGNWSNSWFTAGRYSILYPAFPNQHFDLVIDAQGFPLEGTVPRGVPNDELHDPTLYTGTFDKLYHPFDKKYVPRYAHGRYTDMYGVVYDGDFDYVPGRLAGTGGGYYIFQGVRINEEADEVRPGLYISDWTTNDVVIGEPASYMPITFHRATTEYVAKLQNDLRRDIKAVDAAEAAKLAKERESRENWKSLFTAAVGFVAVVGVMQAASKNSGSSSSISALVDTISGKQTSQQAENKLVAELRDRAKSDPALAKRIGKSTDSELLSMFKEAGSTAPSTMTVAEYRRTASQSTAQAGGSAVALSQQSSSQAQRGGEHSPTQIHRKKFVQNGFNDGGARAATPELAIEQDITQLKRQAEKWVAERMRGGTESVHGVITDMQVRDGCTAYKQIDNAGGYWAKCILDITYEADE